MRRDECGAAAAADGGERRDPSEKQEPHTVMWGKISISFSLAGARDSRVF